MDEEPEKQSFALPRDVVAEAGARVAAAKAALAAAEQVRKVVEAVDEAWPEQPAHVALVLQKAKPSVDALPEDDAVRRALDRLAPEARTRAEEAVKDVVRSLPAALLARGLDIDAASRHPRYSISEHLIDVTLTPKQLLAEVAPRHGDTEKLPLDVDAVADHVVAERARLLDRPFDASAFLADVEKALTADGAPTPMPVRDLAKSLAGKRKPKYDEFAVDLGRLISSPVFAGHPRRPVVNHTRNTDAGLLLLGLERGGYVGTIEMREQKK